MGSTLWSFIAVPSTIVTDGCGWLNGTGGDSKWPSPSDATCSLFTFGKLLDTAVNSSPSTGGTTSSPPIDGGTTSSPPTGGGIMSSLPTVGGTTSSPPTGGHTTLASTGLFSAT